MKQEDLETMTIYQLQGSLLAYKEKRKKEEIVHGKNIEDATGGE